MARTRTRSVLVALWLSAWLLALLAARDAYGEDPVDDEALRPPRPKACLTGPAWDDLDDDTGALLPQGLSEEDLNLAMGRFLPSLERCVPGNTALTAQLAVRMEVACDGRVQGVRMLDDGDLSPALVGCLQRSLHCAEFPAHDLAAGYSFDYRLRLMYLAPPGARAR